MRCALGQELTICKCLLLIFRSYQVSYELICGGRIIDDYHGLPNLLGEVQVKSSWPIMLYVLPLCLLQSLKC